MTVAGIANTEQWRSIYLLKEEYLLDKGSYKQAVQRNQLFSRIADVSPFRRSIVRTGSLSKTNRFAHQLTATGQGLTTLSVILFVALVLIIPSAANADGFIDSLENVLASAQPENKLEVLNDVAFEYLGVSPERTVALAQEAADLAEQRDDRRQLAISLRYMGTGYMWLHEYEEAIRTYSRLLELHDNLPKDSILATVYNNIGVAHKILGDFDNAMENYHKSLRIKEQLRDTLGLAKAYRNIGNVHVALGRHAMALASWENYLFFAQTAKDLTQTSHRLSKRSCRDDAAC